MIFAARELGHLRFELCRVGVPRGGGRIEIGQVPAICERFGLRVVQQRCKSQKKGQTTHYFSHCSLKKPTPTLPSVFAPYARKRSKPAARSAIRSCTSSKP